MRVCIASLLQFKRGVNHPKKAHSDWESMTPFILGMALVAVVLMVSALVSGLVERLPLSFPMLFLGLGFLLGGGGLGVLDIRVHDALLEGVATVSLALVLFLDAVSLQIDELRNDWHVPILTLGPGTILVILGIALTGGLLFRLAVAPALLLGAMLASTDPVVLRDVLRDQRIPRSVRRALGIEAGLNDIVVLPLVLVLIALLTSRLESAGDVAGFLLKILVVSPIVGLTVGGLGAYAMGRTDARYNIRKEYQALYGIGLVLAAYASAQLLGGDGFLASFFAGLAITLFNVTLCECFRDYGEITSEMLMLLAFVLFGAVLSVLLRDLPLALPLLLAVVAIFVVRPTALFAVLQRARMSDTARLFIGWFGPRGLNSLLLALLAVQAAVPNSEWMLSVVGVVVVVSVVVHGVTATPFSAWYGRKVASTVPTLEEEREATFTGLFEPDAKSLRYLTPDQLAVELDGANPPIVLDVRARARYDQESGQIPTSVRVLPDHILDWAEHHKNDGKEIVVYCSCPDDGTSTRVARQMVDVGISAAVLQGGYDAWRANFPLEPKSTEFVLIEPFPVSPASPTN